MFTKMSVCSTYKAKTFNNYNLFPIQLVNNSSTIFILKPIAINKNVRRFVLFQNEETHFKKLIRSS